MRIPQYEDHIVRSNPSPTGWVMMSGAATERKGMLDDLRAMLDERDAAAKATRIAVLKETIRLLKIKDAEMTAAAKRMAW